MARVTCQDCHVQYTPGVSDELRVCPNCGAPPTPVWRRMLDWGWPLPLVTGLVLQVIAGRGAGVDASLQGLGAAVSASRFIGGTLVFSAFAALVISGGKRAYRAWRRWRARRQRRRERAG